MKLISVRILCHESGLGSRKRQYQISRTKPPRRLCGKEIRESDETRYTQRVTRVALHFAALNVADYGYVLENGQIAAHGPAGQSATIRP
jgi:hypothetical protein